MKLLHFLIFVLSVFRPVGQIFLWKYLPFLAPSLCPPRLRWPPSIPPYCHWPSPKEREEYGTFVYHFTGHNLRRPVCGPHGHEPFRIVVCVGISFNVVFPPPLDDVTLQWGPNLGRSAIPPHANWFVQKVGTLPRIPIPEDMPLALSIACLDYLYRKQCVFEEKTVL